MKPSILLTFAFVLLADAHCIFAFKNGDGCGINTAGYTGCAAGDAFHTVRCYRNSNRDALAADIGCDFAIC